MNALPVRPGGHLEKFVGRDVGDWTRSVWKASPKLFVAAPSQENRDLCPNFKAAHYPEMVLRSSGWTRRKCLELHSSRDLAVIFLVFSEIAPGIRTRPRSGTNHISKN